MHRNLFAYTPAGFNPPFISINRYKEGEVRVEVRGKPLPSEGGYGPQAFIDLPDAELDKLIEGLVRERDCA